MRLQKNNIAKHTHTHTHTHTLPLGVVDKVPGLYASPLVCGFESAWSRSPLGFSIDNRGSYCLP